MEAMVGCGTDGDACFDVSTASGAFLSFMLDISTTSLQNLAAERGTTDNRSIGACSGPSILV